MVLFVGAVVIAGCANQQSAQNSPATSVQSTGEVKEFTITAKRWSFSPSTITVNQGDTVKLKITSIDVTHGFSLPTFGVNANLNPGQETVVEFTADKKGTFGFRCFVVCGSGHGGMSGRIVVR